MSSSSSENQPKGAESEDPEDKVTRGNFEGMAKRLFAVKPADYAAEEARMAEDKAKRQS
jgi:hypothetical protein